MIKHPSIQCLIYGLPGSGKTTFLATFPRPIRLDCFDPLGKATPLLKLGEVEDGETSLGVPMKRVWDGDKLIAEIRFYHDSEPETPDAFSFFRREIKDFVPKQWGTYGLDSITAMQRSALYEQQFVVNKGAKQPMQWYAGTTDQLERTLCTRFGSYTCNLVVCAHVEEKEVIAPSTGAGAPERRVDKRVEADADESGRVTVVRGISAPGRLRRKHGLMASFSEVLRAHTVRHEDGSRTYHLQSMPDADYIATTQIGVPDGCTNTYDALWVDHDKQKAK